MSATAPTVNAPLIDGFNKLPPDARGALLDVSRLEGHRMGDSRFPSPAENLAIQGADKKLETNPEQAAGVLAPIREAFNQPYAPAGGRNGSMPSLLKGGSVNDPEVQTAISNLVLNLEETIKLAKSATDEVSRLRGDLARKDQIILEKVANATPATSPEAVGSLVATMVEKGLLAKEAAVATTELLMKDPSNLVKLATKLASISLPPSSQGRGIAKNETAPEKKASSSSIDGWDSVIKHGAN